MTRDRRNTVFAWASFGLIATSLMAALAFELIHSAAGTRLSLGELLWPLVPMTFALVGALIVSRQPRNVIGLLLIMPGVLFAIPSETYLRQFPTAPTSPSTLFLLALWFQNWGWLLLIMPILLVLLLFPTGRPPGPRWRWLIHVALGMSGSLILLVTFARELRPEGIGVDWVATNPIGFIPNDFEPYFLGFWFVALPALTLLCATSVVLRYLRARAVERKQIRWLLYACIVFATVYIPSFFGDTFAGAGNIWDTLFIVGILAIPVAIAIAILRHRLYDIDVIIRRTLQYAVLTGLLALIYFGSVLLLETLLGPLTGRADSPLVVTIITLTLAALFTPLRRRVQLFIDRRFYRSKVDAERALARFTALARDEVDLDQLRAALFGTVGEALQPERVGLWLRPTGADGPK